MITYTATSVGGHVATGDSPQRAAIALCRLIPLPPELMSVEADRWDGHADHWAIRSLGAGTIGHVVGRDGAS